MKKYIPRLFLALAVFLFGTLSAGPLQADLVNPGFEASDNWVPCDGWAHSGPVSFRPVIAKGSLRIGSTGYAAPDGGNFLYLPTANATSERKVYQSFTLGGPSDMTLWYSLHGTGRITLSRPDGTSLLDYYITGSRQTGWMEWQAILSAGDYTLSYMVRGKSSWGFFDNSAQGPSEVPLPSSLLLLAPGLIAVLAIGGRARK